MSQAWPRRPPRPEGHQWREAEAHQACPRTHQWLKAAREALESRRPPAPHRAASVVTPVSALHRFPRSRGGTWWPGPGSSEASALRLFLLAPPLPWPRPPTTPRCPAGLTPQAASAGPQRTLLQTRPVPPVASASAAWAAPPWPHAEPRRGGRPGLSPAPAAEGTRPWGWSTPAPTARPRRRSTPVPLPQDT